LFFRTLIARGGQFQTGFLRPEEKPGNLRELEQEAKGLEGPWEKEKLVELFRRFVHVIDPQGAFREERAPLEEASLPEHPQIHWEPIILFRQRDIGIFATRLEEAIERVKSLSELPQLFAHISGLVSAEGQVSPWETARESWDQILFPLPSNEEQREIIEKLGRDLVVLVQGPPGMGKSHTIANLICHLLAHGKRVLVTSQTSRALKVLYEKLPDSIQPLCITALGDRKEDIDRMQRSVEGILEAKARYTPEERQKEIERLSKALDQTRRDLRRVEEELRDHATREGKLLQVPGTSYQGVPGELARRLREEEKDYGWICDSLSPSCPLPSSGEELREARRILLDIPPERREELTLPWPKPEEFPSPELLEELWQREAFLDTELAQLGVSQGEYQKLLTAGQEVLKEKAQKAKSLHQNLSLMTPEKGWLQEALRDLLAGSRRPFWEALERDSSSLIEGIHREEEAIGAAVEGLSLSVQVAREQAQALFSNLESGGGFGLFWVFRPKIVRKTRDLWVKVRVNGLSCRDLGVLAQLLSHLRCRERLEKLESLWQDCFGETSRLSLRKRVALFAEAQKRLQALLSLEVDVRELERWLTNKLGFATPVRSLSELKKASDLFQAACFYLEKEEIRKKLQEIQKVFATINPETAHRVTAELRKALLDKSPEGYRQVYGELRAMTAERAQLSFAERVLERWKESAPRATEKFLANLSDLQWPQKLQDVPKAWQWAIARTYLEGFQREHLGLAQLQERKKELENKEARLIEQLAASRAWRFLLERMKYPELQSLSAWKQAYQKIGKGTGKYTSRYRREAQCHLKGCRSAVPAWILPFHSLLDTVQIEPDLFDVVIVAFPQNH